MQSISEFFANSAFTSAYNREQRGNKPFLDFYKELTEKYKTLFDKDWSGVSSTDGSRNFNDIVKSAKDSAVLLCDRIVETLQTYLNGNTFGAYEKLAKCLSSRKGDLGQNLGSFFVLNYSCGIEPTHHWVPENFRLFRTRLSDSPAFDIRKRDDIFHPPFGKRHNIGTNRFSIPGYPCLYLGSSLYVCWEEMGRPPLHKIAFSRFEPSSQYNNNFHQKLLYLNFTPKLLEEMSVCERVLCFNGLKEDGFCKYLRNYPLQLACAIPCRHIGSETKFKEEYIIPQLLMQWIRQDSDYHGVCFRTTRVPQLLSTSQSFTDTKSHDKYIWKEVILFNYAYPARNTDADFCKDLVNSFNFTIPISFEISLACPPSDSQILQSPLYNYFTFTPKNNLDRRILLNLDQDTDTDTLTYYEDTDFSKVERNSACFPAKPIEKP
jgi:hypothetical protein